MEAIATPLPFEMPKTPSAAFPAMTEPLLSPAAASLFRETRSNVARNGAALDRVSALVAELLAEPDDEQDPE